MIEREDAERIAVELVPAADVVAKAAPLTGDLLMRGRSRARDLIQPARKTNLRPPMPPGQREENACEALGTAQLSLLIRLLARQAAREVLNHTSRHHIQVKKTERKVGHDDET